ncbi:MAG: TlpA disulfide reductase family protein [Steroidobacteraceae bacterium]
MQNRRFHSLLPAAALLAMATLAGAAAPAYRLLQQPAPDFALRASGGPNMRLSELRGDVVLLAFYGSRCGQCGPQLAVLDRLLATYRPAGLAVLAVNVDDNQEAAREFIAARRVSLPMLLDPEKSVARAYRIDSLPMLLLIDRGGAIRYAHRDFRPASEALYVEQIKALLDE